MGYIITAEVPLATEENIAGDINKVEARILTRTEYSITFDVRGDFYRQDFLTLELCTSLIEAGFLSFAISHSH